MVTALLVTAVLNQKPVTFPNDFLGDWRGTMLWTKAGASKPKPVKMRLRIAKTDKPDTYTYQLTYGDKGEDDRPYLLKAVDKAKGHWQVDERNGIVLDSFVVGDAFVSVFAVMGNTIVTRERREGRNLVSEMITYESTPMATTGDKGPEIPPVTSNRVKSIQRAVLSKVKGS